MARFSVGFYLSVLVLIVLGVLALLHVLHFTFSFGIGIG